MQTSSTIVWWLYNLARFPHVQQKLYQEIESVIGIDDDVTPKHLTKLHYLKASLKESMRYCKTTSDIFTAIDGYNYMYCSQYLTQMKRASRAFVTLSSFQFFSSFPFCRI